MDTEVKVCRSLPPLVEGKIHGSLKLIIDEVLWTKRNPGNITVVASWWGEHNSAQFRPIDYTTSVTRTNENKIEIYAIKTNATLFEDYIKNCETLELMIITEKTKEIIGAAYIDLSIIFEHKSSSEFVPILNDSGNKLGELRVSLQLTYFSKFQNTQLKMYRYNKEQTDNDIVLSTINNLQHTRGEIYYKNLDSTKRNSVKPAKVDMYDTHKSVLKTKRPEFEEYDRKHNKVTDKLITQIVERAQQLRGAILKETYNEAPLALSDNSMSNELYPCTLENEAKLYEYILGKEMTFSEEKKAMDTLKLISPTSSLIDLAFETITACEDNMDSKLNKNVFIKRDNPVKDILRTHPIDYINSIRIFIKSFILSPAGYRRAKSTRLQYGVSSSLTYFVQYDTTFGSARQNIKSNKGTKFTRICAKKQVGQVIDFNSESIYNISREIISVNFPLKFKIFVRHFNHKLSTELGYGSINIDDIANTINLSSTQDIIINNKGIKIGELKVTIELGSDSMHFGKEFIDAVTSTKENIPILEIKSPLITSDNKYTSATGTHSSKSSSKVSSISANQIKCLTNDNNKDLITAKNIAEHQEQSLDNRKVDTNDPENTNKDKILLHGLIYVAEGKDLSESNTYLICRAFWREDKATSQICSNTKNPFYHFFQLVPLIYGTELLERIRDNYIIIEVYSRQNNKPDNLLGIAKLSVHQLYVAYRDPLVLPHLLLSKYPVISVDDWVSINDPINGKYCGELHALVALGTAEQIALLEVSRGLRNTNIISRSGYTYHHCVPSNINYTINAEDDSQCNVPEIPSLRSEQFLRNDNFADHIYSMPDRDSASINYKTQESQTDISSLKDARLEKSEQTTSSEQLVLHTLVDRLANVLHVNKTSSDQAAQTETNQADDVEMHREEIHLNTLNNNSLIDDSDSCSPRNDFQLPTEMYRSVGVGAEYDDEELAQQQNDACNNVSDSSITEGNIHREEINISQSCGNFFFRAMVEIECALHLPKIERLSDSVEPSTYVTFQDLIRKLDSSDQSSSHMVTNVFSHSCDPKWNWRCEAKLPTDLLLNNQKRLIFKVWHLIDPNTSTIINLEKDVVIGFSAIDLSVLMTGFPIISGWFHIMDFTGKCNGQIKITITPLDSLLSLGKFVPNSIINLSSCSNLSQTNLPYMYSVPCNNTKSNNVQQMSSYTSFNLDKCVENECNQNDFIANVGHNLEDVSISSLSLFLKQKLTELDEITKSLQSRLHDVTNTAFEDDFDNDFNMIEQNNDNENTDDKNDKNEITGLIPAHSINATSQVLKQCETDSTRNFADDEKQTFLVKNSNYDPHSQSMHQKAASSEPIDIACCSNSNTRFNHDQYQMRCDSTRNYLSDNIAEYPPRGTKTHINHLLDKLSVDLPSKPPSGAAMPIKKDILELFASLRKHRNNWQDQNKNKNEPDVNTYSVVTQTDNDINERHSYSCMTNIAFTSDSSIDENITKSFEQTQSRNKMSTVIREELIADENNDNSNCDELTTYLITSNIRHMTLDGTLNPLFYQYLIPDLQLPSTASPESKSIEQLDNRYDTITKSFDRITCKDQIDQLTDNDASSQVDVQTKSRTNALEFAEESTALFRLTPSGTSANIDNNIDVIHKTSDNDLTSTNNTESTVALFDKLLLKQIDAKTENHCSIIPELSVSGVSRQAPEGGNPMEEIKTSVVMKQQNNIQDVSTDS